MATERLRVILEMAAGQYKREARDASTATRKIGVEAETTGTKTRQLGDRMRGVGTAAKLFLAGAAAAAVVTFAKKSVEAASDLNESVNAVEVTFGRAAAAVLELGEKAAESVGLSNAEFNALAVGFSAFVEKIAGAEGRSVAEVLDDLTIRIADFASVMNLEVAEAAEKFRSGLAGETEPLRQFGIDVSAAAVNAKALALGLADSSSELTEQDKILARYNLIMEQTEKTAGDFANTSDDLANVQRILKARITDTQAAIGKELLPVMADLFGAIEDALPVIEKVGRFLADAFRGLAIATASSDAERLEAQIGGAVDSAAALATQILKVSDRIDRYAARQGEATERIHDFIAEAGTAPNEIRKVIDNLDFLVESMGLTEGEAAVLAEILQGELDAAIRGLGTGSLTLEEELNLLPGAMRDVEDSSGDLADDLEDTAVAFDENETAAARTARALGDYETALRRLTDPVFKAIDDQRKLTAAQDAYTEAVKEFGPGSQEAIDAGFDLAEAQQAVNESLQDLPGDMQGAQDSIFLLGQEAGVTDETLRGMRDTIDSIDGKTATVHINVRGGERITVNPNRDIAVRQHGGPLRAGQPAIVGEAGPELFVPHTSGRVIPNHQVFNSASRDVNVTAQISGVGVEPNRLARELVDFVAWKQKTSGA